MSAEGIAIIEIPIGSLLAISLLSLSLTLGHFPSMKESLNSGFSVISSL